MNPQFPYSVNYNEKNILCWEIRENNNLIGAFAEKCDASAFVVSVLLPHSEYGEALVQSIFDEANVKSLF